MIGTEKRSNEPKSKKPVETPFRQQKLQAWEPIFTSKMVITIFLIIGIVFIPIGYVLKAASDSVVEYKVTYDGDDAVDQRIENADNCRLSSDQANSFSDSHTCLVHFRIEEEMPAPVYVYYELERYYQNHRKYAASKVDAQLLGEITFDSSCELYSVNSPMNVLDTQVNGSAGPHLTYPCGLIANTMFNDVFTLLDTSVDGDQDLRMSETDISWSSDRKGKFKNPAAPLPSSFDDKSIMYMWNNPNYSRIIPSKQRQAPVANVTAWTTAVDAYGLTNEHLIVWMRTAGLPHFRKLYGRIETTIPAGTTLTFRVQSNFVVQSFRGKKSLVVTTLSWWGEKNPFLGNAYMALGSICLALSLLFIIKEQVAPRKLGDTKYLVWKNRVWS